MLINLTKVEEVLVTEVGGKAFNLHKLIQMQLPVPAAAVLPAYGHHYTPDELWTFIAQEPMIAEGKVFAVRSSGIGEDGTQSSYAGIFESVLNVKKGELITAIDRVKASAWSVRSEMYKQERNASITGMGVIIQHMIDADYAGVAFTQSPTDNDSRIALIEAVKGNGESLVSGKKTPATIRANKLTGMSRITRNGADDIANEILEAIIDKLMPLLLIIEEKYQMPMDVEWAIADDQAYILQARPITA